MWLEGQAHMKKLCLLRKHKINKQEKKGSQRIGMLDFRTNNKCQLQQHKNGKDSRHLHN